MAKRSIDENQISIFDLNKKEKERLDSNILPIVKASFVEAEKKTWLDLFEGYDEIYAITFSSGLGFVCNLLKRFEYAEIIFGQENIIGKGLATVMAVETALVEQITKSKYAVELSERIENETLRLFVSRSTTSHEKIFCLRSKDGRTRVITGSANMSRTAFEGLQRENILYFDDEEAFDWYKNVYDEFKEECSDNIRHNVFVSTMENEEYLRENPKDIPVLNTTKEKNYVYLEPSTEEDAENVEIVTNVKGMESELKPMLPKPKKEDNKLIITKDQLTVVHTQAKTVHEQKKSRERKLPKLHLDYDSSILSFNGKQFDMHPKKEDITSDLQCINDYIESLCNFHGDYKEAQYDYYRFMNWFFATIFIPNLRLVALQNEYEVTTLPNIGIIDGGSNGGKSTYVDLLSKLMTGKKIPHNSSSEFTYTGVEDLRRGIEGVPLNFDDLDKQQWSNHSDKIIKDDEWGIPEHFVNYPAIVITTNKLPSLEAPISKRVVGIRIDVRIGKEEGIACSKKIKEGYKRANVFFFSEYVSRMLPKVNAMMEGMRNSTEDKFPDIFKVSSETITEIYCDCFGEVPEYIKLLSFSDYFGDKVVGHNAIQKILTAWENEKKSFTIKRKENLLVYTYPENASIFDLKYIADELPPQLNVKRLSRSITMNLQEAEKFFGIKFRRGLLIR